MWSVAGQGVGGNRWAATSSNTWMASSNISSMGKNCSKMTIFGILQKRKGKLLNFFFLFWGFFVFIFSSNCYVVKNAIKNVSFSCCILVENALIKCQFFSQKFL